ncbi:MAG: type II toxin-antitoxin system RelE/ParE family toxin [Anaerolineales bacterium]|nr:type II toxin-antitoxin system RelE/ParE family toxin [Anaerolineales bacterium]
MYRLRTIQTATHELERLDKPVARRIAERINWLAANLDDIRPEPYKGDLAGLYKFRIGDYRVIYEILHDEKIIVIHQVGHRSEVYRRR